MTHHSNTPSDPPHEDPRYDEPAWMHEPDFPLFAQHMFSELMENGQTEWPWGETVILGELFQQEILDFGPINYILYSMHIESSPMYVLMQFTAWRRISIQILEDRIADKARSL